MLIADGGGYAGGGQWDGHTVKTMWSMLANQQTDNHWTQVSGWRKAYELTLLHLGRLKRYRESLIEAWPPEKSAAARAYVERLDFLIDTVQRTYDTAVANHETLRSATMAIGDSRRELKKIYDEYVAKEQLKLNHEALLAANPPARLTDIPPITEYDLQVLNSRARGIMSGLSGELAAAQIRIQQPPPYKPRTSHELDKDGTYGGVPGVGSAPIIPPIVPVPTGASYGGSASTPPVIQPVSTPSAPGAGPVLGGAGPIAPTAPINPLAPNIITPTPAVPPSMGGGFAPPLPPGPATPFGGTSPTSMPGSTGVIKPGTGGVAGMPRAMPPGGMIGGVPGSGLGHPAAASTATRRINPVGGVIGGNSAAAPMGNSGHRLSTGTGRTSMTGISHTAGATSAGRTGARRAEDGPDRQWDPDNPWETEEGVAPVVLPAREPGRIDPGPAIGIHR